MKRKGFISPTPPKNAPKKIKVFMAETYAGLRASKFPGENKENKMRAARITWYQTKRKFPEFFRRNTGHMKRDPVPDSLKGRERQIARGARIEYKEHPEMGKKAARQIAIDHILKDPSEYTTGNKYLQPVTVRPASTVKARKAQVRDLRSAAREQRRWSQTAKNEEVSESRRAGKMMRAGNPITAQDLNQDAKVAGTFAKERKALADNYDLQAARIAAIEGR